MPLPKTNEPPARIQIQRVTPQIDGGKYAVKRTIGDRVDVSARIFRDGHEILGAAVRYKPPGATRWQESPLTPVGNDEWRGSFEVDSAGAYCYRIEAWVDRIASWPPFSSPIAQGDPGSFAPAMRLLLRPFRLVLPIGWIGGR